MSTNPITTLQILLAKQQRASNALHAYSRFVNSDGYRRNNRACHPDCEYSYPTCKACDTHEQIESNLYGYLGNLEAKIDAATDALDADGVMPADVDADTSRLECEYCANWWSIEHSCYGTHAEANHASMMEG